MIIFRLQQSAFSKIQTYNMHANKHKNNTYRTWQVDGEWLSGLHALGLRDERLSGELRRTDLLRDTCDMNEK